MRHELEAMEKQKQERERAYKQKAHSLYKKIEKYNAELEIKQENVPKENDGIHDDEQEFEDDEVEDKEEFEDDEEEDTEDDEDVLGTNTSYAGMYGKAFIAVLVYIQYKYE